MDADGGGRMMARASVLDRLERDVGDLLDRHEDRTADLSSFASYRADPVGFIRDVLRGDPWSRQVEVAEAVRDRPLVAVRSCNGAGKDWLAARLALWWTYARGGLVVLTGPTEAQVSEILMRKEVADAFGRARDLPGSLHVNALRPTGEGRAGILAKTATGVSSLTGFHDSDVLFVLTEAQGVDEHAWDAAFAVATGAEDRILALGNPLNPSGRFYRAHRPTSDWRSIRIPAGDVPNVREGEVVVPGLLTRQGVERIASEYGEESGYYTARVLAEFPEEAEEGVFRREWLEAAARRWEALEWKDEDDEPDGPLVAALDPARFGPDDSVLAIRRGEVLRELLVREGRVDTMDLVRWTVDRCRERGFDSFRPGALGADATGRPRIVGKRSARGRIVVDEIGVGGGVLDRIGEYGLRSEGFNAGRAANEGDRFHNRRAEAFWTLRKMLEGDEVALPADERLQEELLALRWRPTAGGKVQLEAKRDVKGRLGRSPDRADAVAKAFCPRRREDGQRRVTPVVVGAG